MIVSLKAKIFVRKKKSDIKRLREEGKIPAVIYGHKEKTKQIYVDQKKFGKVLEILKKEAATINLQLAKKEMLCVIKSVQHNPITRELLHVDFQHIHKAERIKAVIPIHVIGEAPGVKEGGIFDQHLHEVLVRCLPKDMPSHIDVDISSLQIDDTIHLYDIELPKVEFETSKETPVVSILAPRAVPVEVKPAEEEVTEEEKEEGAEEEKPEEKQEKEPEKKEEARKEDEKK